MSLARFHLLLPPSRKYDLDLASPLINECNLFLDNDVAEAAKLRCQLFRLRWEGMNLDFRRHKGIQCDRVAGPPPATPCSTDIPFAGGAEPLLHHRHVLRQEVVHVERRAAFLRTSTLTLIMISSGDHPPTFWEAPSTHSIVPFYRRFEVQSAPHYKTHLCFAEGLA